MMTNTSPRSTTKSRSRWITKLPYAIVRPLTWMRGAWSEADDIEDHREHPVEDNEQDDRRHVRGSRGQADGGGAAPRLHPTQTAGERHHDAEHRALGDADQEVAHVHGVAGLLEVLDRPQTQLSFDDTATPENAHQV